MPSNSPSTSNNLLNFYFNLKNKNYLAISGLSLSHLNVIWSFDFIKILFKSLGYLIKSLLSAISPLVNAYNKLTTKAWFIIESLTLDLIRSSVLKQNPVANPMIGNNLSFEKKSIFEVNKLYFSIVDST